MRKNSTSAPKVTKNLAYLSIILFQMAFLAQDSIMQRFGPTETIWFISALPYTTIFRIHFIRLIKRKNVSCYFNAGSSIYCGRGKVRNGRSTGISKDEWTDWKTGRFNRLEVDDFETGSQELSVLIQKALHFRSRPYTLMWITVVIESSSVLSTWLNGEISTPVGNLI